MHPIELQSTDATDARAGTLPVIENCDDCGACCMTVGTPPFVLDEERDEARERGVSLPLRAEIQARRRELDATGRRDAPCLWFDPETLRCRHHEMRPQVCRDYTIGDWHCRFARRREGIDGA
ncbi:Flagellin N-methylase [Maioricimonas rarisocia]|uniref:Flagellin N-methylase n=1 Tax=Maioricimonas rarisocia TaxID=2528026 RepID=A0A517Z3Z5_9PLAN|nr:YkgJ family cysteine cluster protein [Maioricimonas rarisocia]QDU37210.1 Flagellin N-methylase [Maioricimonas rarisocia]